MSCHCCNMVREYPHFNQYCPSCLYCGARLIQRIGTLPIAESAAKARKRAVLRDWMAMGHPEDRLRALALEKTLPLSSEQWPKKSQRR